MKDANSWLGSVSDMMSGLMMIFLLIAVAFMLEVQSDKLKAEKDRQAAEQRASCPRSPKVHHRWSLSEGSKCTTSGA